jgi:peptide deformylase
MKVVLRGQDLDGKPLEITAEGLMAVCFQHELDHLNGVLFIDHLSRLKQQRIKDKIAKDKRRE